MLVRKIRNHEEFDAERASNICFSFSNQKDPDKQSFLDRMKKADEAWDPDAEDPDCYGAFMDDCLAGIVETPHHTVNFDGGTYDMRGLGNVCAMPAYRKQGVVRRIIETALRDMYREGIVFSYLYPFSYDFYRKLGYEAASTMTTYEIQLRACPPAETGGSVTLCGTPQDYHQVAEVYQEYARRANLSSVRTAERWVSEAGNNPAQSGRSTYVWRDEAGCPRSYLTYDIGKREDGHLRLDVSELCFLDRTALQALLAFVRCFDGFYSHIRLTVPAGIDIRFLLTEHTCVFAHTYNKGMVRIVSVQKALEAARARGTGTVCIGITDPQIPENGGIWRVDFTPERVRAEKTKQAPDLSAPIHTFSALLVGMMDLEQADYFPELTVHANFEALSRLFYRKINWNNERF